MTRPEPTRELTSREWQVVGFLRRGWSNGRIARALEPPCQERTVEAHIEHIAAAIPNPDHIAARVRVMLWARDSARDVA